MSYGEEYVEKYNKNLTELVSNAISTFQNHYNTNYTFIKVEEKIAQPLIVELNSIFEKTDKDDELYQKVYNRFETYREFYTYDKTISVINNEIKTEVFDKTENKIKIKDYSEFINLLSRRESIRYYFNFIKNNKKFLTKEYNTKRIEIAFKLKNKNKELSTFKELYEEDNSKKITNLTLNEKLIIIHIMLNYFVGKNDKIPPTEYFRILSLCSSAIDENDFFDANTNKTKYNYFSLGVGASKKRFIGDKRIIIQEIINKIESLPKISNFLNALEDYKFNGIK